MILYLYAIADAVERVEEITGVCGETPIVITLPKCAVVAGWIAAPPALDRDVLTRQDAVVRGVHERARAALPMRFGTRAADVETATRSIEALGTAVAEGLSLVRDREQMVLRISGASRASGASSASSASGASGVGRRYLERRAGLEVPAEMEPLLEALGALVKAVRVERARQSGIVTVYHLIERGHGAAYLEATNRRSEDLPHLKVRISGPSPAYAFADLGRLR